MHTGKQKQMNVSYQASLVNRHIRRFTGNTLLSWTLENFVLLTVFATKRPCTKMYYALVALKILFINSPFGSLINKIFNATHA